MLKSTAEAVHNLDPVHDIDVCNVNSLANIYDMLVRTTQTGKLVPGVAASWTAPDPSTFTMKLQPNVKFQDGTPYDSQAVAAAIKRDQTDPTSTLKAATADIASVDNAGCDNGDIAPVEAGRGQHARDLRRVGRADSLADRGPEGGRRIRIDDRRRRRSLQGHELRLEQLVVVDQVGRITGTRSPRSSAASTSSTWAPPPTRSGRPRSSRAPSTSAPSRTQRSIWSRESPGVSYKASPSEQYAEIFVNYGVAPFNNLLVRQALEYAVNRQALVTALTGGLDKVAWQPIPPQDPGYDPSLDNLYPYDPAKAKQLLAQAGFAERPEDRRR